MRRLFTILHKTCFGAVAFTLAELVVSLSVIGLISAIGMPTLFSIVGGKQRQAIFKSTIQTVQQAYVSCVQDGTCVEEDFQGFYDKLNVLKFCQGADDSCTTLASAEENDGFILNTGAYVWGISRNLPLAEDTFYIDYNGPKPPNAVGSDVIAMTRCFDEDTRGQACNSNPIVPMLHGQMDVQSNQAASVTLMHSLY
jgi:type II secretory pathway pseudopilin PulG